MKQADLVSFAEYFLLPFRNLPTPLMDYYTYKGRGACDVLDACLLSPKGLIVEKGKHHYFVTCESCQNCLKTRIWFQSVQYVISLKLVPHQYNCLV
jgi:hypothetical protein